MSEHHHAEALWHVDQFSSAIRRHELPPVGEGKMVLESICSLISLGTELTVAKGLVPMDLHASMRVPYMGGEFLFPVKYGYSLVGRDRLSGVMYHVMHPHQDSVIIHPDDVFEVPQGIPPQRATLASNLGTALTGIWDGCLIPGERVAIFGFGMIGSLIARIASGFPAARVVVFDPDDRRRSLAEDMGFEAYPDANLAIPPFDLAYHCSATEEGLQAAINCIGFEGRVVEMSWYGMRDITVNLGGEFHNLRKRILSSQVSNIPGHLQSRWTRRRRQEVVFELLKDSAYDLHLTHQVSLREAAELFTKWRSAKPEGLGYVIRYE